MALAPQQFCVRWNSYHTNLQTVFPKLLSSENFADVTLACENRQLRCHKVVLSACSAYFERLLVQNPCKHPIIFMKDMRFSEMQSLVDFMYKGEVNVTQDDLPSLLKSAEALHIRGLCSGDAGATSTDEADAPSAKGTQTMDDRDFTVATETLLAHAHINNCSQGNGPSTRSSERSNGPSKLGKPAARGQPELKEEQVEEDGLFYGELDHDDIEFNEDEDSVKPGSSIEPSPAHPVIRVKPESKLKSSQTRDTTDYITRLSQMNPFEIQSEFAKYGFTTNLSDDAGKGVEAHKTRCDDNDFYKSWLEQNGELEVSLLKANGKSTERQQKTFASEVELIPRTKSLLEKTLMKNEHKSFPPKPPEVPIRKAGKRGRPPLFKDKSTDIGESVLKADLDQFLEGKEISSSGLSRKDLERVMMGKFNPNRRYSNEAMWAALMDVKKGGSIYRAAQTHKVPRKSLRNWMKRCHIKSSFPMPQQLKQFVENNKRQKDKFHFQGPSGEMGAETQFESDFDIGKHFLSFVGADVVSSDDDMTLVVAEPDITKEDFAIANVQCQYESGSEVDIQDCIGVEGGGTTDHNYDTRDPSEPPAFIIAQVERLQGAALQAPQVTSVGAGSTELLPHGFRLDLSNVNVVNVNSLRQQQYLSEQQLQMHVMRPDSMDTRDSGKRVRRSEVLLKQAADCVSRGLTFQTVSDQFNIPISTIRFFMARKGILPRRRRGRSAQTVAPPTSPTQPPFHMQHYKLPDMVALRGSDSNDGQEKPL